MEFFDLIQNRRSVRAYRPDPVEDDKLEKVLSAARLAPTAANRQPFRLVVMHTTGRHEELKTVYNREWFVSAPLVIAACGIPGSAWVRSYDGKNYVDVDIAIMMDHLILAAADLGLGTCWIAAFNPENAHDVFCLPRGIEPIIITPLGYPADHPRPKERKALIDLVRYERWS